jgi:hypothetical protein
MPANDSKSEEIPGNDQSRNKSESEQILGLKCWESGNIARASGFQIAQPVKCLKITGNLDSLEGIIGSEVGYYWVASGLGIAGAVLKLM